MCDNTTDQMRALAATVGSQGFLLSKHLKDVLIEAADEIDRLRSLQGSERTLPIVRSYK